MQIRIKAPTLFRQVMANPAPLEMAFEETVTLRGVLDELSRRFGKAFEDLLLDSRTRAVRGSYLILVNGHSHMYLRGRLDHPLKDGDEIVLTQSMAGG